MMATPKAGRWLSLFESFISDIRISSKEVTTQDGRGAKLELWDSQKRFIQEVGSGLDRGVHRHYCLKSRQLGITTVSLALDVLWLAMHPGTIGCLVTDDEKKREANRSLLVSYVDSFPDGYFGESFRIVKNNRATLQFSNGSRLDLLVAGTKKKAISWAEGVGYAMAHLTEVSSYGDVEGLKSLEESFAQSNPSRLYMYESTAKGMNHWRTRWLDGNDSITENSFFIGWWGGNTNVIERKDPRYSIYGNYPLNFEEKELVAQVARMYGHKITPEQIAWIRWKESNAGQEQDLLSQNQPWTSDQAFVMTGYSFFQTRIITTDIKAIVDGNIRFKGYRYMVDGDFFSFKMDEMDPRVDDVSLVELKVWDEPAEGGKYVIGMDPAYGRNDHADNHCISVWRCFADRLIQVAEYATADVEPKHAAWVLFHLASAYRDCMINLEIGGPGTLIMAEFEHLRQLLSVEMNIGRTEAKGWQDAAANVRYFLYHKPDSPGAGYLYNFQTNWSTKPRLMYNVRGCYVSKELEIRSSPLLNEMSIVVVDDGQIGAPESKDSNAKDDRVFSMALACLAWTDWVRKDMLAQGLTYDAVMAQESGAVTPLVRNVNNIVSGFLKSLADQAREAEEEGPARGAPWQERNGLC
jgi:hypothetical protein